MTINRLAVSYSERYRGFVVVDNEGRQTFGSDGKPLVYDTYQSANRSFA